MTIVIRESPQIVRNKTSEGSNHYWKPYVCVIEDAAIIVLSYTIVPSLIQFIISDRRFISSRIFVSSHPQPDDELIRLP